MTVQSIADPSGSAVWTTANGLDGFASLCCQEPHIDLLSDPQSFSLTQRVGAIGPVVVAEVVVGSDVEIHLRRAVQRVPRECAAVRPC